MTRSESPIFILGANRSGTTLLRLILNAHSRIAIPDEVGYFEKVHMHFEPSWRAPGHSKEDYARFVDRVLDRYLAHLTDAIDRERLRDRIVDTPRRDFRRPYQMALKTWAHQQGKPRWGEKTPANLFYVDVLIDMFPSAQFIYLARDPRAGVRSMEDTSFFPNDVALNALSRRKHAREGLRLLDQYVPAAQWTTTRYEDLVADPESVIQSLCAFLQEEYEPSMLAFHQDADRYLSSEAARSYNAAATQPITTKKIDQWREDLGAADVAVVERICQPEMEQFGYAPTHHSIPIRRWPSLLVKLAYWHLQCWRNRHIPHYTVKHKAFIRLRKHQGEMVRAAMNRMRQSFSV